jgi:NADPH:quinone reductase-like Zn-dependent oxidoreductase
MTYPNTYHAWRRTALPYPLSIVRTKESLPDTLGAHDVLIRIHAVSLNYRDVAMLREGDYPVPVEDGGVSASDCAAEVIAIGDQVSCFKKGDHVAPILDLENLTGEERDISGLALGGGGPGVLREYAVFEEKYLVQLPEHLPWEEVSTLPWRIGPAKLVEGGHDHSRRRDCLGVAGQTAGSYGGCHSTAAR